MYKDIDSINSDVTDLHAINNSIRNILMTRRGSVPGKPNFGSDLYKVIFSPLNALTEAVAKNYIEEALSEFEDRVNVINITFKRVEEYSRLTINIEYVYSDPLFNQSNTSTAVTFNL